MACGIRWPFDTKGIDAIWYLCHIIFMAYDIEFADEFEVWWDSLTVAEQKSVTHGVDLLQQHGPMLSRPHADTIKGSQYANMKELRVQHEGRPYRILFAFDPRRTGLLLIGGDKTGNNRWYEEFVPKADAIFTEHLRELERE